MPRYPSTERSLVLSALGTAVTFTFFHTFGKHPSAKHLLYSANKNFGKYLCSCLTILPSMPSGPGLLLSSSLLMTSSTSCSVKFGSDWESGDLRSVICALVFFWFSLSTSVELSGKNCEGGHLPFLLLMW